MIDARGILKHRRINSYDECTYMDVTVAQMLAAGHSLEDIICELANEKEQLQNQVLAMSNIVPHRIQGRDGTLVIWYPPEEAIPIEYKK